MISIPPGTIGVTLKDEKSKIPIIKTIDNSSPLQNSPIEPGSRLVALTFSNGIHMEGMDSDETIAALQEHSKDPVRRLTFQLGGRNNRKVFGTTTTTTTRRRENNTRKKQVKKETTLLEYWENNDMTTWFQWYDIDGSGSLSQKEVIDALVDTFSIPQRRENIAAVVKKYWNINDFDQSGYIDMDEFCDPGKGHGAKVKKLIHVALGKRKVSETKKAKEEEPTLTPAESTKPSLQYWENNIRKWFHHYDIDNSGSLTQEEVVDALVDTFSIPQRRGKLTGFVKKYWELNDFDHNGLITEEEFCHENGFGKKLQKVIHTVATKRSKKELHQANKPSLEFWETNDIQKWFEYYDQDRSHSLSQQEVIDGFIDTFSVSQNRAKVTDVIKKYWEANDFDKDGFISETEFCDENGFGKKLKKVIQSKIDKMKKSAQKHIITFNDTNAKTTPAAKKSWQSNNLGKWFDYYDTDGSKTLSKPEVIAALIDTFSVKDPEEKKSIKATVIDVWFLFDLDNNQVVDKNEFLSPAGLAETLKAQLENKKRKAQDMFSYDARSNTIKVPIPAGSVGIALKKTGTPILLDIEQDSPLRGTPVKPGFRLASLELSSGVVYSRMDTYQCIELLKKSSNDPGREIVFQAGAYETIEWT